MAESKSMNKVGHVVVISPPLFGHMIPILDFARCLSAHVHVTFIVSASKLNLLEKRGFSISNDKNNKFSTSFGIDFIGLFDGNDDDYEIGRSHSNVHLESIVNRMNEPLSQLLFPSSLMIPSVSTHSINRPIDLIISDMFLHISIRLAHENNIRVHFFLPSSLTILMDFIHSSTDDENGLFERSFACHIIQALLHSDGIICNSFRQLEKQTLNELYRQTCFPLYLSIRFVAPLIPDESDDKQNMINEIAFIKQWLNQQWKIANESPSVIYVSFGSMACFTSEQLIEIAHFLAPYSVIWSLRTKFHVHLPSSFTNDENHLIVDWAPQRFILSHSAIRIFMSHGGWNSILESMLYGKSTLVWPLFADQTQNAYRLENEFGIGQFILNTNFSDHQHILSSDELRQYLQQMFDRETEYFRKAQILRTIIIKAKEDDSQFYLKEIVDIINNQEHL